VASTSLLFHFELDFEKEHQKKIESIRKKKKNISNQTNKIIKESHNLMNFTSPSIPIQSNPIQLFKEKEKKKIDVRKEIKNEKKSQTFRHFIFFFFYESVRNIF